jgi:hypothetical protein
LDLRFINVLLKDYKETQKANGVKCFFQQKKWWSLASLIFLEYWKWTWDKDELLKSADTEGWMQGVEASYFFLFWEEKNCLNLCIACRERTLAQIFSFNNWNSILLLPLGGNNIWRFSIILVIKVINATPTKSKCMVAVVHISMQGFCGICL